MPCVVPSYSMAGLHDYLLNGAYCNEKNIISCSSTLDFVIENLHPDQKTAREISEFLSSLGDKINNS